MSQGELPVGDLIVAELVEPWPAVEPRPWGLGLTLVFSLVVIVAFIAIETAITIAFMAARASGTAITSEHIPGGLLVSVAEWVSAPVCLCLVILLTKLRRQLSVRDYLSLHRVPIWRFMAWTPILLTFIAIADGTTWLLGRNVVEPFTIETYRTAVVVPLLLAAMWIAAPVFEETFFRGFMFRGIQQSRLGNIGAVLITAFVFAIIHMQYDAYGIAVVFLGGILLGVARATSNSVYLTIGLHSLMNIVATVELWVYLWARS